MKKRNNKNKRESKAMEKRNKNKREGEAMECLLFYYESNVCSMVCYVIEWEMLCSINKQRVFNTT